MKQRNTRFAITLPAWLSMLLLAGVCSSTSAFAQWEQVYGGVCTSESGEKGVAPVVNCGGGGYIAVGSAETSCGSGVSDSYIVRVNAVGTVIWEETVNIDGGTGNDIATSVIELPIGGGVNGGGGFLVVGTTDEPAGTGNTDCYAMELDCNGNVIWVQTYGTAGVRDEARDVTIMQNGNGIPPTPGGPPPLANDYVIAGSTVGGTPPTQDGLLFRITPAGLLVWNSEYNGSGIDFLRAVVEARIVGAGDVVAAGGTTSYGNVVQGLALRVDGNTGTLIAIPPHGLADYGGTAKETFNAVAELTVGANAGNLVFAGVTTVNQSNDIYVVKTTFDPCTMLAQNVVTGSATNDNDVAFDIIEAQNTYTNSTGTVVTAGDLALTGEAGNGSGSLEMFLLTLNSANLNVAGVAKTYGDITPPGNGTLPDGGRSLADDGSGFILCGYETANFLFNNDPRQLYLVKTNGSGVSNCENPWSPGNQSVTWTNGCWVPPIFTPLATAVWLRTPATQSTAMSVCPRQPCIIRLPNNGNDGGHQGLSDVDPTVEMSALRSYPNPVKKGGAVTLEFTSSTSHPIDVKVTNALGQTVETLTTENNGNPTRLGFRTEELPAGVYVIEVGDGTKRETVRIVVTE